MKAIGVIVQVTEEKTEGGETGEQFVDENNPDIEPAKEPEADAENVNLPEGEKAPEANE